MMRGVRGMPDLFKDDAKILNALEQMLCHETSRAGFEPARLPILEQTAVFDRGVGSETDIAQKELYSFDDRNNENLSLRPEGTAGLMRSVLQDHLAKQTPQRFYYVGPMFRYERPQKGRLRQFHQFAAEHIGGFTPQIAIVEMIALCHRLFDKLGIQNAKLLINSLGSQESRDRYRKSLCNYLNDHIKQLDADSQRRLSTNPLRILDSKDQNTQAILKNAPQLSDYLSAEEKDHFETTLTSLQSLGIQPNQDNHLVRGLDYYNDIVFEWVCPDSLGAQSALCGGGQYDRLAEALGSSYPLQAAGFAIGIERLSLALQEQKSPWLQNIQRARHAHLIAQDESTLKACFALQKDILQQLNTWSITLSPTIKSIKAQLKDAYQSHADVALILGEEELKNQSVQVKFLKKEIPNQNISLSDIIKTLQQMS